MAGDDSDDVEMDSKLDELDLIAETDRTCRMAAAPPKRPKRQKRKIDRGLMSSSSSEQESDAEPTQMPVEEANSNSSEKEARLKKQKELQEQFRKKMEEKNVRQKSGDDEKEAERDVTEKTTPVKSSVGSSSSVVEERSPPEHSRPTVVVSTSEVHKTAEMISCLKHDHKLQVNAFGKLCVVLVNLLFNITKQALNMIYMGVKLSQAIVKFMMSSFCFGNLLSSSSILPTITFLMS